MDIFQTNDRIEIDNSIKADVLKVSKNGDRLYVEFWGRGLREGKLVRMWIYASSAKFIRRAA